jgi:hypothetical protein
MLLLFCYSVIFAAPWAMHATVSLSAQDEDIIDKFGEYGAVKAGNPSVIAN